MIPFGKQDDEDNKVEPQEWITYESEDGKTFLILKNAMDIFMNLFDFLFGDEKDDS